MRTMIQPGKAARTMRCFNLSFLLCSIISFIKTARVDCSVTAFDAPVDLEAKAVVLVDPIWAASSQAAVVAQSECPLECQNGASCVQKRKIQQQQRQTATIEPVSQVKILEDYLESELDILEGDEWECDCLEEFTGSLCEERRRELITTTCGNMECQNNGGCAPGQSYESPNALCDCSTAIEVVGTAPNFGLARYVGKYCEIEVKANNFCSSDINMFCVNGGLCRVQAINFVDQPCDCSDEYTGRHCEYRTEHVQPVCSLACSGAGKCQHGLNPSDDSGANKALNLDEGGSVDFMHCVCDDGHAGTNCEYEYIKCGGENRFCYHGSQCVAQSPGSEESCECTNENGVRLAGQFCEYRATDHCETPTPIDEVSALQLYDVANKMTSAEIPFCVNNGSCYQVAGTDDHYCSCNPKLWMGKRCEVKMVSQQHQSITSQPTVAGSGFAATAPSPLIISPSPSPSPIPSPAPTSSKNKKAPLDTSAPPENEGMSAGGKFGIVLVVFGGIAFITVMAIYFHQRAYFIERVVYQGTHTRDSVFRDKSDYPDSHFAPPESHFLPPQSRYPPPQDRHPQFHPPPDRMPHYPTPPQERMPNHYPLPPERMPSYPPPPPMDGRAVELEMTKTMTHHSGGGGGDNYSGGERTNSLHRLNGMLNGGRHKHSYTPAPSSEERDFANVELV